MPNLPKRTLDAIVGRALMPKAFRDLLIEHAPYATVIGGRAAIQCPKCLDLTGAGEFGDVEGWADHILAQTLDAGLAVRRLKKHESAADAAQTFRDQAAKEGIFADD